MPRPSRDPSTALSYGAVYPASGWLSCGQKGDVREESGMLPVRQLRGTLAITVSCGRLEARLPPSRHDVCRFLATTEGPFYSEHLSCFRLEHVIG